MDAVNRKNIVGLLVHGSVTRADFTPVSDVDFLVVVDAGKAPSREYADGGLFRYDYFYHTRKDFESADFILSDPYLGIVLKHGVIIHDPSSLLESAKKLVEEKFDLLPYKQRRVQARIEEMNDCLRHMHGAYEKRDREEFHLQHYLFG